MDKNKLKLYNLILVLIVFMVLIGEPIYALNGEIVMSGEPNFPPYEFIDSDGEYKGFNIDLMRALSIELKRDIKLKPISWVEATNHLANNKIDAIQGMRINEERKEVYDFSEPYLTNSLVLFAGEANEDIQNYEDLKSKRVAVKRGGIAAYMLAEMGEIEVAFFSDLEDAFTKLNEKKIDAVFGDRHSGTYILNKLDIKKDIKILGEGINKVNYGIAVKKGNKELLDEINNGLTKLKRNGTYDKVFEKWFGVEEKSFFEEMKYYIYIILGFLLITIIIIYFYRKWNRLLKKEVDRRTQQLIILNDKLRGVNDKIKERDRFKQQIIDSLRMGLITFDEEENITDINKTAEKIFNLKREDIVGEKLEELGLYNFFNKVDIEKCLVGKKLVEVEEVEHKEKDLERYFNYILSPIDVGRNTYKGCVTTFRDITREKILNEEIAEKDKLHSLGRLITGIAHEIRNPLTSIKLYLEALPQKYDSEKFRDKIITQVPEEINRLDEILKELLNYAKPKKIEKQEFLLEPIVDEVINLVSNMLEENKIKLIKDVEKDLHIYGDKPKTKQILINLLLNSIEAVDSDGLIKIKAYSKNNKAKILVEDNGVGIDSKDLDKLFEPFYTTKKSGTGLGLLVSYQYIKENNGNITVESEKDVGTKISISLNKDKVGGNDEQSFSNR